MAERVSTFEQQKSWASLSYLLSDLNKSGFNLVKPRLHREGRSRLWTFRQRGLVMVIQVPGDGRAQTFDSTLVLVEEGPNAKASDAAVLDGLLGRAEQRLAKGRHNTW